MNLTKAVKEWETSSIDYTFNFVATTKGYGLAVLPKRLGKKNGTVLPNRYTRYIGTDVKPTIEEVFNFELLDEYLQCWKKTKKSTENYITTLNNAELMFKIIDVTTDRCKSDKDFFKLLPTKDFWTIAKNGIVQNEPTLKSNQWISKICNSLLLTEFTECDAEYPFYFVDGIHYKSTWGIKKAVEPTYPQLVQLECKGS